jgi:hypothetical protein
MATLAVMTDGSLPPQAVRIPALVDARQSPAELALGTLGILDMIVNTRLPSKEAMVPA